MAVGKKLVKAREGIDREKLYPITDAIKMVKERAKSKFDETIEIAMNLGVDPRHADQMVRGVVSLPNGTGRTLRVGVFARGAKAEEAKAAGADVVGAEDLVEKVQNGQIDFDRCIATPDMMPLVGRLGKVPRPARHDAEPEDRHRDDGRHRRGQGRQGAVRSNSASKRRGSSRPVSASPPSPRRSWSRTSRRWSMPWSRQSLLARKVPMCSAWRSLPRWVRASRSNPAL